MKNCQSAQRTVALPNARPSDTVTSHRVSIITPAYNAARYLPQAVASVVEQSFQDWELIIINDGSTDATRDYLDTLTDPRIRVIHQENGGVSRARNAGLECARGAFVTFMDADDALPRESLAVRVRYLDAHPEVTVVDGRITVKDAALTTTLRERVGGNHGPYFSRLIRLDSSVFFSVAVMVRRAAIGATRFESGLSHCEDLLFLLEAANKRDWVYGAVDEVVYLYRTGAGSAMSDLEGLARGYLYLYGRCRLLEEATAEDLAYLYRRIRRILVRSWLRRGRPMRALRAWRDLRSARN